MPDTPDAPTPCAGGCVYLGRWGPSSVRPLPVFVAQAARARRVAVRYVCGAGIIGSEALRRVAMQGTRRCIRRQT